MTGTCKVFTKWGYPNKYSAFLILPPFQLFPLCLHFLTVLVIWWTGITNKYYYLDLKTSYYAQLFVRVIATIPISTVLVVFFPWTSSVLFCFFQLSTENLQWIHMLSTIVITGIILWCSRLSSIQERGRAYTVSPPPWSGIWVEVTSASQWRSLKPTNNLPFPSHYHSDQRRSICGGSMSSSLRENNRE